MYNKVRFSHTLKKGFYMKYLKGSLLGGIVFFLWMNISWMLIGWHQAYMKPVGNETELAQAIRSTISEPGMYFIPYHNQKNDKNDHAEFMQKMETGPFAKMMIYPNGKPFSMGNMLLVSFLISCLLSGLITFLLELTKKLTLAQKVMFVELVGLVGSSSLILGDWNWWGYPPLYVVVNLIDVAISWSLVGLVLGKFVIKD